MRRVAYQVVELNCGDTLVDTVDDLHCYGSGIDVLWVKAVTEPRYTSCDLVELDALFAAICLRVSGSRDEMVASLSANGGKEYDPLCYCA